MIELIHGDCLKEMKNIPDGSIDAIICDPPYGIINNIADSDLVKHGMKGKVLWDKEIEHKLMIKECERLLRFNGALILFSQEPYTSKIITKTHNNLPFSYRMTWLKDHFANSLIAKKAPLSYTEDICVFYKKYDTLSHHPIRVYSKLIMTNLGITLKDVNKKLGHRKAEHFFYTDSTQFGLCTEETYLEIILKYNLDEYEWFICFNELMEINERFKRRFNLFKNCKYKSNVLNYKKDYTRQHPTQKPILLINDLVKTYTKENETVLDFTMGSGTTGVACKNLNRNFIGIELDKEYFEIAKNRIEDILL